MKITVFFFFIVKLKITSKNKTCNKLYNINLFLVNHLCAKELVMIVKITVKNFLNFIHVLKICLVLCFYFGYLHKRKLKSMT